MCLTITETLSLHDGEPMHWWRWGEEPSSEAFSLTTALAERSSATVSQNVDVIGLSAEASPQTTRQTRPKNARR
ncbi:MAG: hypothetical protein K2X07_02825 [Caulobacteraceae bacterium]|nr:hypothetical protein [Caulobacteraceae bacterium]